MIGRLWLNKCQICHWRALSLLFMPNGCIVLALFIRWASRAFLTESRFLRTSSIGMRRTSLIEWPAWLKWSDTGVVVLSCWWFRMERRCFPKRSLSWRLVSRMYWRWHLLHSIRYIRFRKFRSEFKWKGPFRFLLTGIFGITSGGGSHISVGKFAVPFYNRQTGSLP